MAKPLTPKQICERALAGSRWLVAHQNRDGSWKRLRDPKVDAFYKAGWALTETGLSPSAHRSLTYVRQNFSTARGDFLPRAHPWHITGHYPYVNAYLVAGSMRAGRYDIALPALSFLLTQQADDHGGFYSRLTDHGGKEMADTASSSAAGIACLAAGMIDQARRVADYLSYLIKLQPASDDRFFTAVKADGQLYTEPKDDHDAFLRVVDTKKADQCWFAVGLPLAFLVLLESATQETAYRELAQWYFDFQQRCIDPWDGYSSGKAAWGCAMLYRITGEARYRDIAMHVAKNIMALQRTDGSWLSGMSKQWEFTNADFDLTSEFTLWLSLISTNVLARDLCRIPLAPNKARIPKPKRTQSIGETLRRTARAHYRILKNEGLGKYVQFSYHYRRGQLSNWIKEKFSSEGR
ncbi:MAG TPA: hypothetical protein VFG09_07670 [Thermodesulfovibrionales bacterium]|nr:hypothetical protein [Thermodesulfovibrionales bacterium]